MKLGTHTAMDGRAISFTTDMLNDIAGSYDPQLSESPIVIGHPTLTAPAYGWVKQTSVEDGTLYAHVGQVDAAFAEAVNEGRYKKRSASIFLPDTPGNPKPGHYYLRHIGFLGAIPPAVKGLADVNFAQNVEGENAFADFAFDELSEKITQLISRRMSWIKPKNKKPLKNKRRKSHNVKPYSMSVKKK
ncbi:hypothetical protein [[Haemophilus] ducreyi]|uniref:hypothetical protein n=1 Tax=Haemophilus ducreyi TaxID=730 RepID=UPI000B24B1D4|nr:hypothetical protein [[Haemophilus] ducreyi]